MHKIVTLLALILASHFALGTRHALAQANFYEGKTVRVIVGLAPGGGYDV